ncbi:hypothetical protein PPOLYM_03452 [Paenibacillus polymyxa]|uniref:hypothetical protein n=1 Tax=Paenibacillus polymyxa TaxID=1406 RepID=UPI000D785865|nr:hypothetical protein [Paenibacillus polymyxa]VUG07044.1 hypothetical protein PPOLYM_03452 [Paenibacillus polymyxa]
MSNQQNHKNDRLQKYLSKAKEDRKDDFISVPADGEDWSIKRLTTLETRRVYELAYDEDGKPTSPFYTEVDVMIVKATEHEFDWNNKDLLKAYGATSKFELPPRILDDADDYAALSKAVRNFKETQDSLLNDAKNSSGETEKRAG